MRITTVRYRTNVEVAPFRHEHAEVEVHVGAGEDPNEAFALAKNQARKLLGIDITEADVEEAKKGIAAAKEVLAKAKRLAGTTRSRQIDFDDD